MKELKQSYVNYLTLINTVIVLGVIVFFLRKWKEMLEREEERETKLERLEKALKDSNMHNKALLGRINKKITELSYGRPEVRQEMNYPVSIEEPIETETRDDIRDALTDLMA